MNILAFIPARSGSKRVPGKNTKILGDLPLITHTILAVQESSSCQHIMVSTDCAEIAKVSVNSGADVPWLRSGNLAEDSSNVIDAVIEALGRFEEENIFFDSVLLLQPTSPFRTASTIRNAIELHKQSGLSVVSVSTAKVNPSWFKSVDNNGNLSDPLATSPLVDSNVTSPLYQLNGAIYIASVAQILTSNSFYSSPTKALVIDDPIETIDIDTPLDWALAEKIVELKTGASA